MKARRRKRRSPMLAIVSVAVLAFLYLPIIVVIINSFNKDETLSGWGGLTTSWYHHVLTDPRIRDAFISSVIIAVACAGASIVLAVTAALWVRRAGRRWARALDASTYLRIVFPEVVAALGLFVLFRRLGFELGTTTVILGHVVLNSAYALLVIQARVTLMPNELEEAAADLGATPMRVFRRVTLPFLVPAIVVAGLLTFTFSFDDVIMSLFLAGSEVETLPMLIFGLARFRVTPELNAIGAGVMTLTLVVLACALAVGVGRATVGVSWRRREKQEAR